ncbi:MAG: hypothetical protein Q4P24_15705 [Rhodobacterales bacterium]|nr:hypothetical protein [Rhodobacterales bacterium]
MRARVLAHAMVIHALCAVGDTAAMTKLRAILTGTEVLAAAPEAATA